MGLTEPHESLVVWCSVCGAWGSAAPKLLRKVCLGRPSPHTQGDTVRKKISQTNAPTEEYCS
jgi:hypothetical protein